MISDPELAERLAHLDARDKLLRQQMTKQTELSQAKAYIGTCQDMCPERERCFRIGSSLSIFERDEHNQPNESAMVKEYRRAGADQEEPLPHDLRTPEALERTMNYLCYNIMDDPRSGTQELALQWYDFLWDRLRAIRKEITQQNICDQASAVLVERCTRFHIHSCYAMNCVKDFEVDMNKRNLNDCLQMLRQMYSDLRNVGIRCNGELEFQKYDILLHLEEDQLSSSVAMKTSEHRSSPDMRYVTELFYAYTNNHYYKFFKLMRQADYMTSCILSLYVNKVRLNALKIIIASCTSKQSILYPASMIIESLGFDDLDDLISFASGLSIEMQEKKGNYYLVLSKDMINVLRQTGSNLQPLRSVRLVESKKRNLSVGELVHCQPLSQPKIELNNIFKPTEPTHESPIIPTNAFPRQQSKQSVSPLVNQPDLSRYEVQMQIDHHEPRPVRPIIQPFVFQPTPTYQPMSVDYEKEVPKPVIKRPCNGSSEPINPSYKFLAQREPTPAPLEPPAAVKSFELVPSPIDQQDNHQIENTDPIHDAQQCEEGEVEAIEEEQQVTESRSPSPEVEPGPSRLELLEKAAQAPVCRLRFRQPPRFHPFQPTPDKTEKPKRKSTSFNDSVQSLKDEISDEMKANDDLMKIVRMLS